MALPSSGQITAAMVNVELGRAFNTPFNLNDPAVRALAGKPSGAISFNDFHGKSSNPAVVTPLTPVPRAVSREYNNIAALADITFSAAGTWTTTGSVESNSGNWLVSGDANRIHVRLTPTSGAFGYNNASNWTPIGSARATITATETSRFSTCTFKIEMFDTQLNKIIGTTGGCYLEADCDPGPES